VDDDCVDDYCVDDDCVDDDCVIEAAGIRLAYRVWGSPGAPPLVLLHGLGEGAADWDGVAPAFARRRRVYAPDLRGHRRSDRPGDYSVELMEADVRGFLDVLELDRVDLIGHSMGGLVGYLLAGDYPERVGRLILEDVAALRPRERGALQRPEGELPYDWEMVLAIRRQIESPDPAWLARLGRITAKTLVIGGGAQSHVPQDWVADLARDIPGARMETIEAGHLIHQAEPEAFTRAALTFFGGRPE
jgi:pimeloyl-ACP methyl ester carboxylesterase